MRSFEQVKSDPLWPEADRQPTSELAQVLLLLVETPGHAETAELVAHVVRSREDASEVHTAVAELMLLVLEADELVATLPALTTDEEMDAAELKLVEIEQRCKPHVDKLGVKDFRLSQRTGSA